MIVRDDLPKCFRMRVIVVTFYLYLTLVNMRGHLSRGQEQCSPNAGRLFRLKGQELP